MTQVRCKICKEVEKKKLLVPKFNGLQKHGGHWKATSAHPKVVVDQYYINNMFSMLRMSCISWVNFYGSTSCEWRSYKAKRKFVQFVVIFHVLKQGQHMLDFKGCEDLFDFFKMPKNLQKH